MFEKLKQLSRDTAVYGVSTMAGRFLNFLLVPFYTHVFLPSEYGIISLIYLLVALFNIVYIYGMDSAYLKFTGMGEEEEKKNNFSTAFISIAATSLLFSLMILLMNNYLMRLLGIPEEFFFLGYYTSAILFIDALSVIPFITLRLERKAKKFASFKILNISINIAVSLFLILILKWGIEAVLLANVCASVLSLLLLAPTIKKELRLNLQAKRLRQFLKFGLPYLPAGIAAMLIQVIDRYILENLTDLSTVGIYQANYKLGIFMMLFVSMFQFAWQPFFLQTAKEENAKEVFAKVLSYFMIIGSVILITLSLFIENLVKIEIFGKTLINYQYWGGLDIVPIILFAYLFNGMYVIFTAGIYIKEKSQFAPLITGAGAVVNIFVNLALIPVLGIMGAALATFASYFVLAGGMYFVTQKFYKIEYETFKIIKIFLAIIVTGSLFYYLYYSNLLITGYKFLLLLLFIALLFIFVIEKKEITFFKERILKKND